jgi:hypothetical protein
MERRNCRNCNVRSVLICGASASSGAARATAVTGGVIRIGSSFQRLLVQRDVPGLTRAAVPVLANPGWQIGLEVRAHNIALL